MDTQSRLLDKSYVEIQVRQLKEIKQDVLHFNIEQSNRKSSQTLYVSFYYEPVASIWVKGSTLRISDHLIKNKIHTTFLINPDEILDKKTKLKFIRTLKNTIKVTYRKQLNMVMKRLENGKTFKKLT